MVIWDKIANIQNVFKKKPDVAETPTHTQSGWTKFGIALDIAKMLPVRPGAVNLIINEGKEALTNARNNIAGSRYNEQVEKARVAAITGIGENLGTTQGLKTLPAAGAALGGIGGAVFGAGVGAVPGAVVGAAAGGAAAGVTYGIAELDKATNGKLINTLMSSTKGLRSNYAFIREATDAHLGLGLLAGLAQTGGTVAGAVVGAAAAGALAGSVVPGAGTVVGGIAAGGAALGAYFGGKQSRMVAESGILGEELKAAAEAAQSPEGQEKYNFGRDTTRLVGKVTGIKALEQTDTGIGAVASGIVNVFSENLLLPEVKALQITGKVAKATTAGGVTAKSQGIIGDKLQSVLDTPMNKADRLEADVDLLKRTAAGEETVYTPMFEFINKNDIATVKSRTEFRLGDSVSTTAAALMAGKSYEQISLILRVGRGDAAAVEELSVKHAAVFAQVLRAEGKLSSAEAGFSQFPKYNTAMTPQSKVLKAKAKDKVKILDAELEDYRKQYTALDDALRLDSALQERTVSIIPLVEKLRNDMAKQRNANKLGFNKIDDVPRETFLGTVKQRVWQSNPLGAVIRTIERYSDDAPHSTVNFNDYLQSSNAVRTNLRSGVQTGLIAQDKSISYYNAFLGARSEAQKLNIIEAITKEVFDNAAQKYNLEGTSKDLILNNYVYLMRSTREKAKNASDKERAFMIDSADEIVRDPQLISQLANGSYLPDIALIDKAFNRFAKKQNDEYPWIKSSGVALKAGYDDFNSLWRMFTLARTGYPINIVRDSTFRVAADGQYFNVIKNLGKEAIEDFTTVNNSVGKIQRWTKGVIDKDARILEVKKEIQLRSTILADVEKNLKKAGYDITNPPKKIKPEVQLILNNRNQVKRKMDALLQHEQELLGKISAKVVGPKTFTIGDYAFDGAFGGPYGRMSMQQIRGKNDIRALLASDQELMVAELKRGREGGKWIVPTLENKEVHIKSWENVLVNILANDPIALEIMKGTPKAQVLKLIKSDKLGTYIDRFGFVPELKKDLRRSDAQYIYDRVGAAVNQFAPDARLQTMVAEGKVSILELEKMFPDVTKRPGVSTDLALDLLSRSNFVRTATANIREGVTWMATVPTSKLIFNPYFRTRYEEKLQGMVAMANSQGRIITLKDQRSFDAAARAYAIKEVRSKINGFSRDMNYPAAMNYLFSFFPAVVEQWRTYGRTAMENPEFPYKVAQMITIPEKISQVKIDESGQEYISATLPVFGGIEARFSPDWFSPINPTGGSIISTSPAVSAIVNQILKESNTTLPGQIEEWILPFGTQSDTAAIFTPTTIRRTAQAIGSLIAENPAQLNKDTAMLLTQRYFDFRQEYHRDPNATEITDLNNKAKRDAVGLGFARALGSLLLPKQPRYVTPLQTYSDILKKYTEDLGQDDGTDKFIEDYPDYFMILDKISDPLSGLNSDRTSVELVKRNMPVVEKMVTTIGSDGDLSVLGAVFNDSDYAFSSSAQAWLTTHSIPNTKKKFRDQQTALENTRSSVVNKGWKDWNVLVESVTQAIEQNDPPYDPTSGFGKAILDGYKEAFVESMKAQNPIWVSEKADRDSNAKLNQVVDVLTIAANDKKLGADLAKQARWHSIVEYLNFRHYVKGRLDQRGVTINAKGATDIKAEVDRFVLQLRKEDVNFGKFYDRYFDNDNFSWVTPEKE
jgi:hypothetical protein